MNISNKALKYYFSLTFIIALFLNIKSALLSNIHSWGLTEWLINYSGGFVRRGLPGEIIGLSSFDPRNLAISISFLSLTFLLGYLYFYAKKSFPFYIIISPVFMGFPYWDGILRKDIFLLALLAILLRTIKCKKMLLFSIAIITIGMLSHELFFFISIPLIFTFLYLSKSDPLQYVFYTIYPIVLMLFLIINKGDIIVANSINQSWIDSFVKYCSSCDNSIPSAAIDAIGWSSEKGLSLSLSLLNNPLSIFAWVTIIILCIFISLAKLKNTEERPQWLFILLFQLAAISPLFIVGWDFGRWISIWMVSSLLFYINLREHLPILDILRFRKNIPNLNIPLILLSIPGCCIGILGIIYAHPLLGIIVNVFRDFILPFKEDIKTMMISIGLI